MLYSLHLCAPLAPSPSVPDIEEKGLNHVVRPSSKKQLTILERNNSHSSWRVSKLGWMPHRSDSMGSCCVLKRTDGQYKLKVQCEAQRSPAVLESSCMEETYDILAKRLVDVSSKTAPHAKYLVAIAGPPGAGKSTVAQEVVARVNNSAKTQSLEDLHSIAVAVPMDGFHLYRWQLDAMENPVEAHARRGAPWTFDPVGLANCLASLRNQGWAYFPSFDHGVGDPIERDIYVSPSHKIVVVEGNYLMLPEGDWKRIASYFNERWFLNIDIDTAMGRVEKRHIATGKSADAAKWRVEYNDRPNAELILKNSRNMSDLIIESLDQGEKVCKS